MEFKASAKPSAKPRTSPWTPSVVQRVPKLILGRQEDTRARGRGSNSYLSRQAAASVPPNQDKSKRVLNVTGWTIGRNSEWIKTGKAPAVSAGFNYFGEYDSHTGKDTGQHLGTDEGGLFKIISNLTPPAMNELTDDAIGTKTGSLYTDRRNLTATDTGNNHFLMYLHANLRTNFSDDPMLFNGVKNEYTVLAQEIQQLINAGYIFRKVPSFSKTWGAETLMAFPDASTYNGYIRDKKARQDGKTGLSPSGESRAAFKARL